MTKKFWKITWFGKFFPAQKLSCKRAPKCMPGGKRRQGLNFNESGNFLNLYSMVLNNRSGRL